MPDPFVRVAEIEALYDRAVEANLHALIVILEAVLNAIGDPAPCRLNALADHVEQFTRSEQARWDAEDNRRN